MKDLFSVFFLFFFSIVFTFFPVSLHPFVCFSFFSHFQYSFFLFFSSSSYFFLFFSFFFFNCLQLLVFNDYLLFKLLNNSTFMVEPRNINWFLWAIRRLTIITQLFLSKSQKLFWKYYKAFQSYYKTIKRENKLTIFSANSKSMLLTVARKS